VATIPKHAVIAGCARDCARYLPAIQENLRTIARMFEKVSFIAFENDSTDGTKEALKQLLPEVQSRSITCIDGLDRVFPFRTQRLAFARNTIASVIRESECRFADYVALLDFDDVNALPLNPESVWDAIGALESDTSLGAAFANSNGPYYDLWALRHPVICPNDVWLSCEVNRRETGKDAEEIFDQLFRPRLFVIPVDLDPIEVESAFGGLGFYKSACFTKTNAMYIGEQTKLIRQSDKHQILHYQACEHVSFHHGVRMATGLKLKIFPGLINRITPNQGFGHPSIMKGLAIGSYPINEVG